MFWTRAILWKIIKVLGYLIGMVRYYPARKKKYFFCPILDTSTCMQTYLLLQDGKEWHESQEPAVYHGALGYQRYTEHLHSCKIRGCRGGDEEGCSNLNGLNTTKSTGVRLGICTPVVPLFPQKYRIL